MEGGRWKEYDGHRCDFSLLEEMEIKFLGLMLSINFLEVGYENGTGNCKLAKKAVHTTLNCMISYECNAMNLISPSCLSPILIKPRRWRRHPRRRSKPTSLPRSHNRRTKPRWSCWRNISPANWRSSRWTSLSRRHSSLIKPSGYRWYSSQGRKSGGGQKPSNENIILFPQVSETSFCGGTVAFSFLAVLFKGVGEGDGPAAEVLSVHGFNCCI